MPSACAAFLRVVSSVASGRPRRMDNSQDAASMNNSGYTFPTTGILPRENLLRGQFDRMLGA